MVDGSTTRTTQETEDGNLFDESVDLEDIGVLPTPMDHPPTFDEEFVQPNGSSASVGQNPSTLVSSSRRQKKRKASMASSWDVICESIQEIRTSMKEAHLVKVDKGETKEDIAAAFAALKAIPRVSRETLIVAYDSFTSEPTKAWEFLQMSTEDKEECVRYKFGGFQ